MGTTFPRKRAGEGRTFDVEAFAMQVAAASGQQFPDPSTDPGDLLDARGWRRPPQCLPGYDAGREPLNKGERYAATPPTVAEIMAMLRACPDNEFGWRMKARLVLCWQGSLRNNESGHVVLADLTPEVGEIFVRKGKGGKTATITMAAWAWPLLEPWTEYRRTLPDGPYLCVIDGPTAGVRGWANSDFRTALHNLAREAGVKRRCAPHQLRHAWAIQDWVINHDLKRIQHHLRHSNVGITVYLQALGVRDSHRDVFMSGAPTVPATALLELASLPTTTA